ncbi:MAG: hypothetical protein ACXWJ7_07070 [Caldimonas sp.]
MNVDAAFWARLLVAVLATWRLTHLIAREDGPADLIVRLRAQLGGGWLGHLMDCFNCASLWLAAPLAWWLATTLADGVVLWLALSGAVCLLERASGERLVIQPLNTEPKGESDGMLRTEPGGARTAAAAGEPPRVADAAEPAGARRVPDGAVDSDLAAGRHG